MYLGPLTPPDDDDALLSGVRPLPRLEPASDRELALTLWWSNTRRVVWTCVLVALAIAVIAWGSAQLLRRQ